MDVVDFISVIIVGFCVILAATCVYAWYQDIFVTGPANKLESARQHRQAKADALKQIEHNMIALALTCRRCGQVAPPIQGTGNRYRCDACGNQFAGARHGM
jgi:hypothetical protein